MIYKSSQQFDKALEKLELLLLRENKNQEALEQKALLLSWTQKLEASIETWKKLIKLDPSNLKYRIGAARAFY